MKTKITLLISWFKTLSLKKKLFFIAITLIGLLIVGIRANQLGQPSPYTVEKVVKSDITEFVTESGNITVGGATNIYSPTNGIVIAVNVTNGEEVNENQELFSVKSSATQQEVQAAYANYLTAQSALNAANSTQNSLRSAMYSAWQTYRNMATNSTYENSDDSPNTENRKAADFQIAQDNWYAAEKKYKDQQTAISQAQAQTTSTWLLYQATQDSVVKSTARGTVSNLSVTNGGSITINSALAPVTPALVVTSGSTNEIIVAIGETDIAKIRPGQNAKIDVNAVNNKTYKGIVTRVDSIGTKIQGVITYNVYLKMTDPDENTRPGMSIDAEITTKKLTGALSVPNSAVKPYQGGKAVRIPGKKKGEVVYIPVEIGIRGKSRTQILKGLTEGQTVITTLSNEQIKRPGLFGS